VIKGLAMVLFFRAAAGSGTYIQRGSPGKKGVGGVKANWHITGRNCQELLGQIRSLADAPRQKSSKMFYRKVLVRYRPLFAFWACTKVPSFKARINDLN
jgi:hypothetical protein